MRRSSVAILCILCFLVFGTGVFADVIYIPDDSFYASHFDQCQAENRRYTAAVGSAAQISPVDGRKAFDLDSDFEYNVSATFTDSLGTVWGCIEKDGSGDTGWIPMTSLSLVYDGICFEEDHKSEFLSPDGISPKLDGGAVVYEYPGGPHRWVFGTGTDFSGITFSDAWKDEGGFVWLHVTYYLGIDGWICADNPLAGADDAKNSGSEPVVTDPSAPEITGIAKSDEIIPADPNSTVSPHVPKSAPPKTLLLAVILTLSAAVLAGALTLIFLRKRKKG